LARSSRNTSAELPREKTVQAIVNVQNGRPKSDSLWGSG
jgi:hypothetical protein